MDRREGRRELDDDAGAAFEVITIRSSAGIARHAEAGAAATMSVGVSFLGGAAAAVASESEGQQDRRA